MIIYNNGWQLGLNTTVTKSARSRNPRQLCILIYYNVEMDTENSKPMGSDLTTNDTDIHFESIENALLDVCSQDNEIAYVDAEEYVNDSEEYYD
jgi:hypothetical protein